MFNFIKKVWNKWWNELFFPSIALIIWFLSPFFISGIDKRAGVYDNGVLQIMFFTFIQFAFYAALAWMFIRATFPVIFNYFQTDFKNEFKNISSWERLKFSMCCFFAVLLCFALLSRVL